MKAKERSVGRMRLILSSVLALAAAGCATHVHQRTVYGPPPVVVGPPPPVLVTPAPAPQPAPVVVAPAAPTPVVVIQAESDFHEPLSAYGRWVVVPGYGYSWVPARVETDWRPYADGYWQRTDAGWYWMSEEPWGWATYHYGRWDWNVQYGWFWVPQTQWAPAWVCWREGGGFVGWAPLRPSVSIGVSLTSVNYEPAFASRAYVFVKHRHMMDPVRPKNVVVNNTTLINQTVNITKVNVVNKTVINEGPRPDIIERESGRKIQTVAVRDFRHREETAVAGRNRNLARNNGHQVEPPVRQRVETGRTLTPGSRPEQPMKSKPEVTQPSTPAPSLTVSSPAPTPPKRDEIVRQERRQLDTPVIVAEPRQSVEANGKSERPARPTPNQATARPIQTPEMVTKLDQPRVISGATRSSDVRSKREQHEFGVRRVMQAPSSNSAITEAKPEAEPPAKPESKRRILKASLPVQSQANADKRPEQFTREQSRSSDQLDARSDERGNRRGKKERH
jgi:hypothetical protein